MSVTEKEIIKNNKHTININELIQDYRMLKKEISRLEKILFGETLPMSEWNGVSQYGVNATLPKGSRLKSQAELKDMDLREQKQYKKLLQYYRTIFAIESACDYLAKEILKIMYDCILSGMNRKQLAEHLNVSLNTVDKLKCEIWDTLNSNVTFSNLLHNIKMIG